MGRTGRQSNSLLFFAGRAEVHDTGMADVPLLQVLSPLRREQWSALQTLSVSPRLDQCFFPLNKNLLFLENPSVADDVGSLEKKSTIERFQYDVLVFFL